LAATRDLPTIAFSEPARCRRGRKQVGSEFADRNGFDAVVLSQSEPQFHHGRSHYSGIEDQAQSKGQLCRQNLRLKVSRLFHQKSRDRRDLRDPLADELVRPFHKALPLLETPNFIEQIFGSSGSSLKMARSDSAAVAAG
jgi:hypothetical protein